MHVFEFESTQFDENDERPNPFNPIGGEGVLRWLCTQLANDGFECGAPDAEDWGWYAHVRHGEHTYLLGARGGSGWGGDGKPPQWTISLELNRSIQDRLSGRNTLTPDDAISVAAERALRGNAAVSELKIERNAKHVTDVHWLPVPALNAFSQEFADRLLAAHPEWRDLVHPDPDGFPPPGSLLAVVPSPVAGRELRITTRGNRVRLDFGPDGWHQQFPPQMHGNEASPPRAASRFIDDLLLDRIVVATRYVARRRLWSRAITTGGVRGPRFGAVKVISWSGARDATLSGPNEAL